MTINRKITKVFGIGLNKTGTTTLGHCGKLLGYRCTSCSRELLEDIKINKSYKKVLEVVENFDLFEDWPWPLVYKEIDKKFPGSKFILTTRKDETTWLNSLKKYSSRTHPFKHCRKLAYGYNFPHYHENEHINFYKKHHEDVINYFDGREKDFLEVCWERGDGWEKICQFLDHEIPDMPFPHANSSVSSEKKNLRKIMNIFLKEICR